MADRIEITRAESPERPLGRAAHRNHRMGREQIQHLLEERLAGFDFAGRRSAVRFRVSSRMKRDGVPERGDEFAAAQMAPDDVRRGLARLASDADRLAQRGEERMRARAEQPLVGERDAGAGTAALAGSFAHEQVSRIRPRHECGEVALEILPPARGPVWVHQRAGRREVRQIRDEPAQPSESLVSGRRLKGRALAWSAQAEYMHKVTQLREYRTGDDLLESATELTLVPT
jgi:hypothetical protein